uniref:Uncharacterized protein n=1 Tax=Arundo donax TaxID=35708 RepID=A0A0A9CAE3_ARUDO
MFPVKFTRLRIDTTTHTSAKRHACELQPASRVAFS